MSMVCGFLISPSKTTVQGRGLRGWGVGRGGWMVASGAPRDGLGRDHRDEGDPRRGAADVPLPGRRAPPGRGGGAVRAAGGPRGGRSAAARRNGDLRPLLGGPPLQRV